jgi:hypothetical protein
MCILMSLGVHFFTYVSFMPFMSLGFWQLMNRIASIHHPFLLSDNRHYTFYVWRRVFMLHPIMPYLLVPGYLACAWAWFIRIGSFP